MLGRLLSRYLKKSGYAVLHFDIQHGCDRDLSNIVIQDVVLGWIRSGIVIGVWLGTPCTTWSIAHTSPLVRTVLHIQGVALSRLLKLSSVVGPL